jgi:hypothetical protein
MRDWLACTAAAQARGSTLLPRTSSWIDLLHMLRTDRAPGRGVSVDDNATRAAFGPRETYGQLLPALRQLDQGCYATHGEAQHTDSVVPAATAGDQGTQASIQACQD